jgi:hypothetical protein
MARRRMAVAVLATAGLLGAAQAVRADMGKSPAAPNGVVLSFEGGYLYQDGPAVNGHGVSDVLVTAVGDPVTDVFVSPEDGYFFGGLIGFDTGKPFIFGFHRIELHGLYGETDESVTSTVPPNADIVLSTVDGSILGTLGTAGTTSVERRTWEGSLRFEDDDVINATTSVTWVFAPFIRGLQEETVTSITTSVPCCEFGRSADVDATLYGVFVAAEPETWISQNFALVARLGVGIYGYDADGDFASYGSAATTGDFDAIVSDSESGVGFRGLLGIGFKAKITAATLLEGFAEADYFSDVPTAHLTNNQTTGGYISHVQEDDLFEVRTGLRLTVGLGGGAD